MKSNKVSFSAFLLWLITMLLIIIATGEEACSLKGSVDSWKLEFEFVAIFCHMTHISE